MSAEAKPSTMVYVLVHHSGEYSDYWCNIVGVFPTLLAAKLHGDKYKAEYNGWHDPHDELAIEVHYLDNPGDSVSVEHE